MQNALAAIRRGIAPDPKAPSSIPGLNIPPVLSEYMSAAKAAAMSAMEGRDSAVARLEGELEEYEPELRAWLEAYASLRWPTYATVVEKVAVFNDGENRADDITLRIAIPDDLVPVAADLLDGLQLEQPPEPPRYEERNTFTRDLSLPHDVVAERLGELTAVTRNQRFAFPSARTRDVADGPVIRAEQGRQVAMVRLDALTHGVTVLSEDTLKVMPRQPGTYELPWEAHVSNLRRPARGTIVLEVAPMTEDGPPLVKVSSIARTEDVKLHEQPS